MRYRLVERENACGAVRCGVVRYGLTTMTKYVFLRSKCTKDLNCTHSDFAQKDGRKDSALTVERMEGEETRGEKESK